MGQATRERVVLTHDRTGIRSVLYLRSADVKTLFELRELPRRFDLKVLAGAVERMAGVRPPT